MLKTYPILMEVLLSTDKELPIARNVIVSENEGKSLRNEF
jgi:hypothetical protein